MKLKALAAAAFFAASPAFAQDAGEVPIGHMVLNGLGLLGPADGRRGLFLSVTCRGTEVIEINTFSVQDELYMKFRELNPGGTFPGRNPGENGYRFYQDAEGKLVPLFNSKNYQLLLEALTAGTPSLLRADKIDEAQVRQTAKATCEIPMM